MKEVNFKINPFVACGFEAADLNKIENTLHWTSPNDQIDKVSQPPEYSRYTKYTRGGNS